MLLGCAITNGNALWQLVYLHVTHCQCTFLFLSMFYSDEKSSGNRMEVYRSLWVTKIMANEKFVHESYRCVYENDDILTQYNFMSYPDDIREAVMLVAIL